MNKLVIAAALIVACSNSAFAAGNTATSSAAANALNASNQGNAQNITFVQQATEQKDLTRTISDVNYNYSGSYEMKNVPSVVAPSLTSSNDTCMGSTSIGAAGVGIGLSFGSSWTDDNCVMLKNSRELYNMGMKAAAMARMCMDAKNKEALELTGFVCLQTKKDQTASSTTKSKSLLDN